MLVNITWRSVPLNQSVNAILEVEPLKDLRVFLGEERDLSETFAVFLEGRAVLVAVLMRAATKVSAMIMKDLIFND